MKVTKLEVMNNINREVEIKTVVTISIDELYINRKILDSNEKRQLIAEHISKKIMEELIKRVDI